jgi:hypothetical protein
MKEPNPGEELGAKLDVLRSKVPDSPNAIIEACWPTGGGNTGLARKAAALKFLLYLHRIEGGPGEPGVWLWNPPAGLRSFPLTQIELAPDHPITIGKMLRVEGEPLTSAQIAEIAEANRQARQWVDEVLARLDDPSAETRKLVDELAVKWFIGRQTSSLPSGDRAAVFQELKAHFELVSKVLHSGGVIFSDHPPQRYLTENPSGDPITAAARNLMEKSNVIYLVDRSRIAPLNPPSSIPLSRIIFHEMMHLNPQVGEDFRYTSLAPGPVAGFPTKDALRNAASLENFGRDLMGKMSRRESRRSR